MYSLYSSIKLEIISNERKYCKNRMQKLKLVRDFKIGVKIYEIF